jgi:hypothetical protein
MLENTVKKVKVGKEMTSDLDSQEEKPLKTMTKKTGKQRDISNGSGEIRNIMTQQKLKTKLEARTKKKDSDSETDCDE